MHIVLKNHPPSPIRGGDIEGWWNPPPPMPYTTTRGLVLKGLRPNVVLNLIFLLVLKS